MITVTDAANDYICKMIAQESGAALRLSIKKTGCSGYSYAPQIITQANSTDILHENNGVKIYLDPAWLHLLQGIQIDYVEEEKSGLRQKRLLFINPNESSRCGCGESFHVE